MRKTNTVIYYQYYNHESRFFFQACFLIAVYTWFFVPETRGKSLAEIQTIFGTLD